MLDNNFIVKYITSRNCFLILSEANIRKLSFQKVVKLIYDSKELYCSCILGSEINDNNHVGIPSLYAKALGIAEHQAVCLSDVLRIPTLGKIMISPVSTDDYEILDISSDTVQSTLLDQIRVVNKNQHLTIWISKWLHVTVKIDETEPMPYGCLANLTEVYISPPPKQSKSSLQTNGTSLPTLQDLIPPPEPKNTKSSDLVAPLKNDSDSEEEDEVEEPPKPEFEDCAELRRLKKYLTLRKPIVYRVCPIKHTSPENITKSDVILNYPFNVFIFKQDVPKFMTSNSYKQVLLCKISKIEVPADCKDKDDKNQTMRNDIVVRVCIFEDFRNFLSSDAKNYFVDSVTCSSSDKHPIIFVPENTMSLFDLKIGSKIIMGTNFEYQTDVRNIEVICSDKKYKNVVQRLKTFLADFMKYMKCVINAEVVIELEPKLFCLLKLNPLAEFCVFDEYTIRNCKFYENNDKRLEFNKHEIFPKFCSFETVCPDICDFKSIAKQSETLLSLKNRNENILIVGKPGTGKTTLVSFIAEKLSSNPHFVNVVYVECKKLKGKSVESLHKYFNQEIQGMIYYQPSLLILEDLYIICGRSDSGEVQTQDSIQSNRVGEMVSELLEMHQKMNKICVIVTSTSTLNLNENILSSRGKHLFRNVFKIIELDKKQRECLLQFLFEQKTTIENDINFEELATKTEGYVAQDLIDFVNKSIFESYKRNVSQVDNTDNATVSAKDIDTVLSQNVALALRNVKLHTSGEKDFRDVGGLNDVKNLLIQAMNWPSQYPDLFNDAPLRLQSGILLYGPPGVGKTLLVGSAAQQCGLRLIAVKGPELLSKYIGASEQGVRNIFEKAQSARPCILFFDEFDSLAPRRGHDSTGVTDRVVNQLLTQLDGVESLFGVIVVAATSRPDLLDPALLRPGRLDRQVLCPIPNLDDRLSILKALSRCLHFTECVNLNKIAEETEGFSGADLQAVLYTAQLYAVEDAIHSGMNIDNDDDNIQISSQHLEDSLKGTGPSLTKHEAAKYEQIYTKFQAKKKEVDATTMQQKTTLA